MCDSYNFSSSPVPPIVIFLLPQSSRITSPIFSLPSLFYSSFPASVCSLISFFCLLFFLLTTRFSTESLVAAFAIVHLILASICIGTVAIRQSQGTPRAPMPTLSLITRPSLSSWELRLPTTFTITASGGTRAQTMSLLGLFPTPAS